MGTLSAIYVRGELPIDPELAVEGEVELRRGGGWTELLLPGVQEGTADALRLSRVLDREVVAVVIQTTASVLAVTHARGGAAARTIETADGTWRRADGPAEPWEAWLFSDEERREAYDLGEDEDALAVAFDRREIVVGASLPRPNEWQAIEHVLGMSHATWSELRRAPAERRIAGAARLSITRWTVATFALAIALLVAGVLGHGDVRAICASLGVTLFLLASAMATFRRIFVGRRS